MAGVITVPSLNTCHLKYKFLPLKKTVNRILYYFVLTELLHFWSAHVTQFKLKIKVTSRFAVVMLAMLISASFIIIEFYVIFS